MDRLDEIEARCNAATPGEWVHWVHDGPRGTIFRHCISPEHKPNKMICADIDNSKDLEFIAHSREDVPFLLDEVRRLREELAEAKAGGWISVEDRLPEDDCGLHFYDDGMLKFTSVLCASDNNLFAIKNRLIVKKTGSEYLDRLATDGWIWSDGWNVSFWRPLPEPPVKEDK